MRLLLIRHARPFRIVSDAAGADPGLTPDGEVQAKRLAVDVGRGRYGVVDRIVSSPMRRAAQTAAAVDAVLGLGVNVDDRLAELDRGWTSYRSPMEFYDDRRDLFADMNAGRIGENTFDTTDFRRRVVAAVDAAASTGSAVTAIVCHGGVINAYLAEILGTSATFFTEPYYTSVTCVSVDRDGHRELLSLNETGHLRE
ncbi:histidine phosphatase family protein [Gordonia sp. TBRC 11910]|uniref:Histidine phosphatase family protein n=1 Tax=Gordonia asplenii TaxID=2725283 RepID=A0A848LB58_9ACTN|nr:histidine phosphatase family protein [Gordonia asplenii]NMO04818.1 histidine phosphatase family protein [Gordonia asplenii]